MHDLAVCQSIICQLSQIARQNNALNLELKRVGVKY